MDEFEFSAPSFHNFVDGEEETFGDERDDGYFDRLRKSTIQQRQAAIDTFENTFEDALDDDDAASHGSLNVSDADDADEPLSTETTDIGTVNIGFPEIVEAAAVQEAAEEDDDADVNPTAPVDAPSSAVVEDVIVSAQLLTAHSEASVAKVDRKRKASETSGPSTKPTVTVPTSPHLRVLKRIRSDRVYSSTTRELQQIAAERDALIKQKKKFQATYTHVKTGATSAANAVPRSVKPLTQPVDVTLRVDGRVRPEDEKPTEPFHSFAEKVLAFCSNIGHSIKATVAAPMAALHARVTSPAPFKLATDELASRRAPAVLSKEQEEDKMMKEMKPFKARPVDPRVMASAGDVGVAKVPRKPTTVVQPFALESERLHKKAQEEQSKALQQEELRARKDNVFKATPVPTSDTAPLKHAVKAKPLTCPLTPHFATDKRAAVRSNTNNSGLVL